MVTTLEKVQNFVRPIGSGNACCVRKICFVLQGVIPLL